MSNGYGSKRCNFCGNDYARIVKLEHKKWQFGQWWLLNWKIIAELMFNLFVRFSRTMPDPQNLGVRIESGLLVCTPCGELDNYPMSRESLVESLEAAHLNDAQKKVFIRYGMIHPKTAVALSPDITLEDLNYRPKTLAQQTPGGCLMVLIIMFGLIISEGGWLLGISGMIFVIYWVRKGDKDWDDDTPYTNYDDTDNSAHPNKSSSSPVENKKPDEPSTLNSILYILFLIYVLALVKYNFFS
tara:strand:- start:180 stop:905 length:726 start_codon:yes stop_codon:yes gene_type:complete